MRQLFVICALVCLQAASMAAQTQSGTIRVQVRAEDKPIEKAEVRVADNIQHTDASGTVQMLLAAGEAELTVVNPAFVLGLQCRRASQCPRYQARGREPPGPSGSPDLQLHRIHLRAHGLKREPRAELRLLPRPRPVPPRISSLRTVTGRATASCRRPSRC